MEQTLQIKHRQLFPENIFGGFGKIKKKNEDKNIIKEEKDNPNNSTELDNELIKQINANNLEEVKRVIKRGANVNTKIQGWPAIKYTIFHSYIENKIFYELLENGVNPNTKDDEGETLLIIAAKHGDNTKIEKLIKKGAQIDTQNKEGDTALMKATQFQLIKNVKTLLRNNANVNIQNEDGETALMIAAYKGFNEAIKLLLSKKTDVNIKNKKGNTALKIAIMKDNEEFFRHMRYGGDYNENYKQIVILIKQHLKSTKKRE